MRHANSSTHRAAVESASSDFMVLVSGKRVPLKHLVSFALCSLMRCGFNNSHLVVTQVPAHEAFKSLLEKLAVQDYAALTGSDPDAAMNQSHVVVTAGSL